jgi:hypothetical protein
MPKPRDAATQSAAQAAIATGLANSTASGLRISVSSSSFHSGIDLGQVGEIERALLQTRKVRHHLQPVQDRIGT